MIRFELAAAPVAGKVFSRRDVNPRLDPDTAMEPAAFLARLWTLFGPPERRDDGFEYELRDRETGLGFSAYSGASGPSYGGDDRKRAALRPVVEAFERLLEDTPPVDCELEYVADIEYGGGTIVIGWKDGRPLSRSSDTRTPPESARDHRQCVAIASEYEGGYGALAGWQHCLAQVMPDGPDEVTWNGRSYAEQLGFTLDERGDPMMIYIGPRDSPENVPLAAVSFDEPLPALAQLWLDAFARWKREAPPPRARQAPKRRRSAKAKATAKTRTKAKGTRAKATTAMRPKSNR